jgi:hypothetical protein
VADLRDYGEYSHEAEGLDLERHRSMMLIPFKVGLSVCLSVCEPG